MDCPNCQNPNPAGAFFCSNCGTRLPLSCRSCGAELAEGARFCNNCGQPVSSGAVPVGDRAPDQTPAPAPAYTSSDLLERYIPRELLSRLESARSSHVMEGERRVVTILFCDVTGSTQAAAKLDPEEWAEIINGAFEYMIEPIYRYEGTVARLQGDGLLAFFGAPIAHEDDPERAVLAGLEILAAIQPYSEQICSQWEINFNLRVGINTGLVVVGEVGSDLRVEYSALGDAINMAARMEQNAEPGTVLVAAPTHKLVAPIFETELVEGLNVRGRDVPVTAYRIVKRKAQRGSLRGLQGLNAPLIGRRAEMDVLWEAADELSQGRGQIVSVMGEAGLGKSRLITEFRRALLLDPAASLQWLEGRTFSYETATPYAPFISMIADFFSLVPGDKDEQQYRRIVDCLDSLFPGRGQEIAPFFAAMMGLELHGEAAERIKFLQPPQLHGLIFEQVSALVDRLLASGPLVIYIDDLHWADPTSLKLFASLLPKTDVAPLMLIASFRPRRQEPSWEFHESASREYNHRYKPLELEPLDQDQARHLVANLLQIDDLPENVRQKILEKSEGNPFFVEEVIRSLLDSGLVVRVGDHWQATQEINEIDLPDTLVGVITARLDRLGDSARHFLQAGAILGREFATDVLDELVDRPAELEGALVELQRREMVREKSRTPQHTFIFKHALTQDAAYNSMLLSRRRELHGRAAEILMRQTPEMAAEIARHLLEAHQPGRALPYLVQAGDRAARAYATEEAIIHYRQVIDLKRAASDPALLGRAYEGLGQTLVFANRVPEAFTTYQEMLDQAESADDISMKISALNKLAGVTALHMGQFQEGELFLERAESLSRRHNEKSGIPETALIRCQMC
ncbi:MAG: AAA family ATPase, partial [Anaerolineales bacterium]